MYSFYQKESYTHIANECRSTIITGYRSAVQRVAYGANYMFDRATYRDLVAPTLTPCYKKWTEEDGSTLTLTTTLTLTLTLTILFISRRTGLGISLGIPF